MKLPKIILSVSFFIYLAVFISAQPPASPEALVKSLPEKLQAMGTTALTIEDAAKRAQAVTDLAKQDTEGALNFLLQLLSSDSAAIVRRSAIVAIGNRPQPKVIAALEKVAAADPDADLAIFALARLRVMRMAALKQVLKERVELAKKNNDQANLAKLYDEQERWISLGNGTTLPAFMRVAPPLFNVKPTNKPVRVLTLGDFGYGDEKNKQIAGEPQKQVVTAMLKAHKQKSFDFALTLGDNFYPTGMFSPSDPRWKTLWSDLYDPLKLKFYVTYGNHDWGSPDSPISEILFSQQSKSWVMPAPYYTYTAGPIQFFALDTNEMSEKQLQWLNNAISTSTAQWKVVYGHHPIYSGGAHSDNKTLIAQLLPILKNRVDIFLAGHDHDLQHLKAEDGVQFFVNGGGGAAIRKSEPGPRTLFAKGAYGFATIEADLQNLTVKYFDTNLVELYKYTLAKPAAALSATAH